MDSAQSPQVQPPRLEPDIPLPPYRYLPGRAPHPLKHPQGHLRNRREHLASLPSNGDFERSVAHRYAIDLFNHGYFWEAHEAWESLWRLVPRNSPEWYALRGLIQASAALLKLELGQTLPSIRLRDSALQHLHSASTHVRIRGGRCAGVDLVDFCERFEAHAARPESVPFPSIAF